MKAPHLRARYFRIMTFFSQTAAEFIIWELFLSQIGFRKLARSTRSKRYQQTAARFRGLAIRMGGVMIKVGQFLSTRLDVLPPEITAELAGLQDEVPAEEYEGIRQLAESELGASLGERFESFESQPLAAASLGQVHRARLHARDDQAGFRNVVVKIQRPFIEQLIEVDLSAIRKVGSWLRRYKPVARRVDVPALVEEFSSTIREEIDYLAEGRNAELFAKNFKDVPRVHVPRVVWSHTTRRVLTLEDVYAIKITDFEAITAAGIERSEVAVALLDTYLKQIFSDGFFHADPHPGNLFVTPLPDPLADGKKDWRLTFVDFGMVGNLPEKLRTGLRELLISIGTQDAARLVRTYQTMDMLLPGADLKLLEKAEAQMFEVFWGKSMSELRNISHAEMFRFADQFRDLMYDMPFQLPNNLLMLGRCVAILSGMCTGLDKDFNLWALLAPYATKLVSQEAGSNWRVWLDEAGNILKQLISLPGQAGRVMGLIERGELVVQAPAVQRQLGGIELAVNRVAGSVIFSALLIGGILLLQEGREIPAYALLAGAGISLLATLFSRPGNKRRFHG